MVFTTEIYITGTPVSMADVEEAGACPMLKKPEHAV
jgi:hypothetical protein